jgi:hypothetical protein
MTRRAVAVVVFVVLLFGAAVAGVTAYVVGGGSARPARGRCEVTAAPINTDNSVLESAQEAETEAQAERATRDQNPDECPTTAHWQVVG